MHRAGLLWVLLVVACLPAWAQEPIGFVKTLSGDAMVVDSGKYAIARIGTPVRQGNVLKTGINGSMGISFRDNTMLSFGSDTELTIDEYAYAPASGNLKFTATMSNGTLQMVSGVIARLRPEAVVLKTPTGAISPSGARVLVKVER